MEKLKSLRENASRWALADDSQLCTLLGEVTDSLVARAEEAHKSLQSGSAAATRVMVRVSNLNNRLSSFANDQFIENRVYDEAPFPPTSSIVPTVKSVNDRQEETVENMRQAVALGFDLIRSHFKRIEMRSEYFDEDDDPTFVPDPVFEPYDSHLSRPLPFVIGSREWSASPSAGICEVPSALAKGGDEEVVVGLPSFVPPRLPERTENSVPTTGMAIPKPTHIVEREVDVAARAVGSAGSTKSDHSGLFADEASGQESSLCDIVPQSLAKVATENDQKNGYLPNASLKNDSVDQKNEESVSRAAKSESLPTSVPSSSGKAYETHDRSTVSAEITTTKIPSANTAFKDSLFGDSDSDVDIFADSSPCKPAANLPRAAQMTLSATDGNVAEGASKLPKEQGISGSLLTTGLFDEDSDDEDFLTDLKIRAPMPAEIEGSSQSQATSSKPVFRSGDRISADFANRLSGLIISPPKVPTAVKQTAKSTTAQEVVSRLGEPKRICTDDLRATTEAPKDPVDSESVRFRRNPCSASENFKSRLSAVLLSGAQGRAPEDRLTSREREVETEKPAPLSSIAKTRAKGPLRRAPTRAVRGSATLTDADGRDSMQSRSLSSPSSPNFPEKILSNTSKLNDEETERQPDAVIGGAADGIEFAPNGADDVPQLPKQHSSSLFSDSDDDFFGGVAVKPVERALPTVETTPVAVSQKPAPAEATRSAKAMGSIFSSDTDDEDLFGVNTTSHADSLQKSSELLTNAAASDEGKPVSSKPIVTSAAPSAASRGGIFADDSDSDTDLFK